MQKKPKLIYHLMLLLLVLAILSPGCTPSKKPLPRTTTQKPAQNVKLAPEVAKYKEEPQISVYRHSLGKIQYMPLEKYLEGVIAGEVGVIPGTEDIKAQAIVARTMTLALINYENGVPKYHAMASDSHTEFQAYDEKGVTDRIRKAVKDTRGQVMLYNGKFVYAMFHSEAGGKTAALSESFPTLEKKAGAYLKVLPSYGDRVAPAKEKSWTAKFSKQEVMSAMGNPSSVDRIQIKRGPSGRALTLSAGGKTVSGAQFRTAIGPDRLMSTMITSITASGNSVVFKGRGWGHGAGMEQWGAYALEKEGKKAMDIVKYYYPGTIVRKLYK
ncbi:MAG: SpoIID/LytB domain-containing protein [Methylocystaceae bacterium]